ncbi:phosphatidylglycerophosphatase A family protein [Biformimicrobium ophioploci]|uniref:Phosphatidylglycerophosphatase A n=1 Tax=Biformimicrobium ophioploci TaxID=3036711 RepID=A0ABQ6M183_9GAMM|nr:phosphatidylglycerophosphatase A [Microbulbifer sp. NKW57]GMG88042.1 phosphatidylglycerophosphatase A [Microbulbifer sp. NKW57]
MTKQNTPTFGQLLRDPVMLLAFGFGSGLVPKGPGTAGTLAAIPLWLLIAGLNPAWYLLVLVATALLGIYLCGAASRKLGVHDHGGIVWDEMVGYWITMFMAPAGWGWALYGFVLFRIFDIAKPWPIGWLDRRVHGGAGIMLDDIVAALFAAGILQLTAAFML